MTPLRIGRIVKTVPARVGLAAALLIAAAACASTELQTTWVKPDAGPLNFKKVVAIALSKSPVRRRLLEDAMVGEIHRVTEAQTVPSYTLISDADVTNEARVRDAIDRAGFDAGIFLRVTDVKRRDVFVPGRVRYAPVYYRTFWGYYRYWTPIMFEPGYLERETSVQVETEVYSTAGDGELIYAAVSRTVNPSSPADLVEGVASVVVKDLKARGLLRSLTPLTSSTPLPVRARPAGPRAVRSAR